MATIKDVANRAGVSIAAVSYYLNGKTEHVRADTAERIQNAVDELNYTRSPIARSLATGRSHMVGVLVCGSSPYGIEGMLIMGIAEGFLASEYQIIIKPALDAKYRAQYPARVLPKHVDGAIIIGPLNSNDPNLGNIYHKQEPGKPMIVMEDVSDDWGVTRVNADNYQCGRLIAEEIVRKGHKSISVLYRGGLSLSTERRLDGILDVCRENSIRMPPEMIRDLPDCDREDCVNIIADLIKSPHKPTALISIHGGFIFLISDAVKIAGVKVGEDLDVGFADYSIPFDYRLEWPITLLKIDEYEIGVTAARTFLEMLKDSSYKSEDKYFLPEILTLKPKA